MDFSNRHTNEFVNLCDLENVLGGVSVCLNAGVGNSINTAVVNGVNVAIFDCTGGNADSKLLLRKSLKNIVIPDSDPESEVGECKNTFVLRHCERSEAIQTRVSRGWNAFAKVDKTILQNVELPFNANEQDIVSRLLRRFTPRNDSNSNANKKKAGVK